METHDYSDYRNPDNYILVGSTYYKKVCKPTTGGEVIETLSVGTANRLMPTSIIIRMQKGVSSALMDSASCLSISITAGGYLTFTTVTRM